MIEIKNLKKYYGERTVLDIPELIIKDGEMPALAGANGSGKTTLLKILGGIIKASEGNLSLTGNILYMPQNSYAFRGDTVRNIMISGADRKSALELLEKLELSHLADKKAKSLSGGELQRLSLCRVLSKKCDLLLLDEPTSACDAKGAELVINAIREYRNECGCTVIMSTHSPMLALNASDRLIILNAGKIESDGFPGETLANPESQWAKSFAAGWKI